MGSPFLLCSESQSPTYLERLIFYKTYNEAGNSSNAMIIHHVSRYDSTCGFPCCESVSDGVSAEHEYEAKWGILIYDTLIPLELVKLLKLPGNIWGVMG